MSITRNNHYVPEWYQGLFHEAWSNTLAYLNLDPPKHILADGRVIKEPGLFNSPPSRAFRQRDLYSTFFGTAVNDEIERRLFGDIDTRGSEAVKAFNSPDPQKWHEHFQSLFEYIDIQKIRTPKGLAWLASQYPSLSQNALMMEMQEIRTMHCSIWAESVREIVSAENSSVKFIVSDHPVTIYNPSAPPGCLHCTYPNDPSISLKGSQTVFPLSRNLCLILTSLEYARDPTAAPLEKRIFARHYKQSMVKTDAFIRTRRLSPAEVLQINFAIKARAKQFVAAGNKEWLQPEGGAQFNWADIASTLRPPASELWHFGGQIYVKFNDGHVHYQDEYGRTEEQRDFLIKPTLADRKPKSPCGCGSGKAFHSCCANKPVKVRPSWSERSIRERNLMLFTGLSDILGFSKGKDWLTIRRDLSDQQIGDAYFLYDALWPKETDLLDLLPKPDGTSRAVYSGILDPDALQHFAIGLAGYFDEVIIQHPFTHASSVNNKFSPIEKPRIYRQEFLKSVALLINIIPLIDLGLINLVPDPTNFDDHLRKRMWELAQERLVDVELDPSTDKQFRQLFWAEHKRGMMSLPRETLKRIFRRRSPELNDEKLELMLDTVKSMQENDPLAPLQTDTLEGGEDGGQLHLFKLAPNFEMSMYIAQATGSCLVTDSSFRWKEIQEAVGRSPQLTQPHVLAIKNALESSELPFQQNPKDICERVNRPERKQLVDSLQKLFKYLSGSGRKSPKPNVLQNIGARISRDVASVQTSCADEEDLVKLGKFRCLFPQGGIQNNTINRLLLMSSSEFHMADVPMALFVGTDEELDRLDGKLTPGGGIPFSAPPGK